MVVRDIYFFLNDTATTEIYTLSLHDALPIYPAGDLHLRLRRGRRGCGGRARACGPARRQREGRGGRLRHRAPLAGVGSALRSEEHTSELQSPCKLAWRLLLEKKKHRRHLALV